MIFYSVPSGFFFQSEIQTESTTEVKFSFLKLIFKSAKDIPKRLKINKLPSKLRIVVQAVLY
jgi:hypothetical protein